MTPLQNIKESKECSLGQKLQEDDLEKETVEKNKTRLGNRITFDKRVPNVFEKK